MQTSTVESHLRFQVFVPMSSVVVYVPMDWLALYCLIIFTQFLHLVLNLQLHNRDIISQNFVSICQIPPWRWPKKAETCRTLAVWLCISVSNCCTVGISTVRSNDLKWTKCNHINTPISTFTKCYLIHNFSKQAFAPSRPKTKLWKLRHAINTAYLHCMTLHNVYCQLIPTVSFHSMQFLFNLSNTITHGI